MSVWTTLNEPWCSAFLGYGSGVHAPGRTDPALALRAGHHLLLAHGLGVKALRAALPPGAQVSITLNLVAVRTPAVTDRDLDAQRRVDGLANRLFLDPLLRGALPEDVIADTSAVTDWSFVQPRDAAIVAAPFDLLGVNYAPAVVAGRETNRDPDRRDGHPGGDGDAWPGCETVEFQPQPGPRTAMGWPIDASGLHELLRRLRDDYGPLPVLITENGAAFDDHVRPDGSVSDPERVQYIDDHLRAVQRAFADGVDVRGYFVWSLLDNFEWSYGYSKRFGIVHVDYSSQRRTPKQSAHWYSEVVRGNRLPPRGA